MGLELVRLHALHILPDRHDLVDIHAVLCKCVLLQQLAQRILVQRPVNHLIQLGAGFRLVAIADCLDDQLTKRTIVKARFAQNVEYLSAQRGALLLQLLKQPLKDSAFAGFLGDEIPQVANLRLTDSMNAAEALLEAVRIPRQVIVDHEMRTLQVDAFTGSIRGNQDADILVLFEQGFDLSPLVAQHAAMDGYNGFFLAKQSTNLRTQIVQRIPVLGKDDELLALTIFVEHEGIILQDGGKLIPFPVGAAHADCVCHVLQALERFNLRFELCDGSGSRGLVGDFLFLFLQIRSGYFVKIIRVFRNVKLPWEIGSTLPELFFCQPDLKPFTPAVQRLIDGFRRGGKAALQDRESETNAAAVCAIEVVSAVELLLHICRYVGIQLHFHWRQIIVDSVCKTLRKQGCSIKLQ